MFRSESGLDPLVQVLEVLITSELNMNQAAPGNTHLPVFEWLSVDVHECKTRVRLLSVPVKAVTFSLCHAQLLLNRTVQMRRRQERGV